MSTKRLRSLIFSTGHCRQESRLATARPDMPDQFLKPKPLLFCLVLLAATIAVACGNGATATPDPVPSKAAVLTSAPTPTYWPTEGWRSSTPEQQGMDSELLLEMLDHIREREANIHSLLILRKGHLVLEAYFDPYHKDISHVVHSVTKSITSALVGIAIDQGYIDGVDQPVLSYFPERTFSNIDPAKQAMTIEHLLTMTSGLSWPELDSSYISPSNPVRQMYRSQDAVQFVLDSPMAEEPGVRFNYNTGASHLLSAVIQETTGISTLSFAQKNLFGPLGISGEYWPSDQDGITAGGIGIRMTPRDMAKFGYLYLNDGIWDGVQVVPAEWIETSTTPLSIGSGHYGYQWRLGSEAYWALGWRGQRIVVIPDLEMVVVFTGEQTFDVNGSLLDNFIFKAAKSSEALPENPEGVALLESRSKELGQPEPKIVPPLPETAQRVSGNTYLLDTNNVLGSSVPSLDWRSVSFDFKRDSEEARIYLSYRNDPQQWELTVGLDDVFRVTHVAEFGPVALKGSWQGDNTFILQNQLLGPAIWAGHPSDTRLEFRFTFEEDGVDIQLKSLAFSLRTRAELQD